MLPIWLRLENAPLAAISFPYTYLYPCGILALYLVSGLQAARVDKIVLDNKMADLPYHDDWCGVMFWHPAHLPYRSLARQEAVVISGRKLARQIREEARVDVDNWVLSGHRRPHLSVVLVGDNPASHSYVLNKTRSAAGVGKQK